MRRAVHRMTRRWTKAFDRGAEDLARYFVDKAAGATDIQLRDILKKAGFTVEFRATPQVNNAMQAAIGENVGLIVDSLKTANGSKGERFYTDAAMKMRDDLQAKVPSYDALFKTAK